MDQRSSVRLVVNDTHLIAYFATNLAVTFIRRSTLEGFECPIRPAYGADTSFTDPATSRVHLIEGEISLPLHYAEQQTVVTTYVVQNDEIGVPIVLGMDSLIALQGRLLSRYGDEDMNPHYPIPDEEDLTEPRSIYSTGLTVSMASLTWQQQSTYDMEPSQDGQYHLDLITNTRFPILGRMNLRMGPGGENFCVMITRINTQFMLGLDFLRIAEFRIKFPGATIRWPRTLAVHPVRRRAVAINGPTCPRYHQLGHLRSQCTGRPRSAERNMGTRAISAGPQQ
jgi:hypothetical protein